MRIIVTYQFVIQRYRYKQIYINQWRVSIEKKRKIERLVLCVLYFSVCFLLQIVEVLTESLTLKETPIPTKVARLMLVSDVLHNSSAPVKNASAYRTRFEATLPDIMESFNDLYRSITGRITAEALKVRCTRQFHPAVVTDNHKFFFL